MYDKTAVLKIDLKTWNYGGVRPVVSKLLHRGFKCCLGFECLLRGFEESQIEDVWMPSNINLANNAFLLEGLAIPFGKANDSMFSQLAAYFNDITLGSIPKIGFITGMNYDEKFYQVLAEVNKILVNGVLETEEQRRQIIKFLFKFFLDREVEFILTENEDCL